MRQSTLHIAEPPNLHVAVIMDGNGRWAAQRGLPRLAGHRAGAEAVRRIVEASPSLGIHTLTLYAFSSDNWKRPPREVRALIHLFRTHLETEVDRCIQEGVRLTVIGRRDRLHPDLVAAIEATELATAQGRVLNLRLAVDYSGRDVILRAAACLKHGSDISHKQFSRILGESMHAAAPAEDVDLLIRTGGEQRLSDFLLWECAYAELYFTDRMWPDFSAADLAEAVRVFHGRDRRFGSLSQATAV